VASGSEVEGRKESEVSSGSSQRERAKMVVMEERRYSRDRSDFLSTIVGRAAKAKVMREATRMEKKLAKEGRRWKPPVEGSEEDEKE